MQQILEMDKEVTLMIATVIYNLTGAHLALCAKTLLMVDPTHTHT